MTQTIAIIGCPNSGKTTLFNRLTGSHARVGNWPGVTLDRLSATLEIANQTLVIDDLPGIYELPFAYEQSSIEERVLADYLQAEKFDLLLNVVDVSHLQQQLYLTVSLRQLGFPMVLVLTHVEEFSQQELSSLQQHLSAALACPVLSTDFKQVNPQQWLSSLLSTELPLENWTLPTLTSACVNAHQKLQQQFNISARVAWYLLEGCVQAKTTFSQKIQHALTDLQNEAQEWASAGIDILLADGRYRYIQQLLATQQPIKNSLVSVQLDRILLHPLAALPIFLLVMLLLFGVSMSLGAHIQQTVQNVLPEFLVLGFKKIQLFLALSPHWILDALASGFSQGLATVVGFIPMLCVLFAFLAALEACGYMARISLILDRFMRVVGCSGQAFIPFILGFACNVPAILAVRGIKNQRDRILTVLMTPFMSCSARMAVYVVFAQVFFADHAIIAVFLLYLLGIFIALLTGFLLRHSMQKANATSLVMELPDYEWPQLSAIWRKSYWQVRGFLLRGMLWIVPSCMLLGVLAYSDSAHLPLIGQFAGMLLPVFSPMGVDADNWQAIVALFSGVAAKEVLIASLNTLYALPQTHGAAVTLGMSLQQHFHSAHAAFAYLLFVSLYIPCISTVAAIARSLNVRLAVFSTLWSLFLAYLVAVVYYQLSQFAAHPGVSSLWLLLSVASLTAVWLVLRFLLLANWRLNQGGGSGFVQA